ncbi:MAG: methyltransferase domain-containing protein [Patescibacteria group bacterium]
MFSNPEKILKEFQIGEGTHVGDFGVGVGSYALAAAEAVGETGSVYAFDIQKDMVTRLVKTARDEKITNLHVVWADLEEPRGTKLADTSLDAVIVANLLFQIEAKDVLIGEVIRVLKPNGRVLIVDWKESFGHTGPHPDAIVPEKVARPLFEGAGFVFERSVAAGEHHYGLVFRKNK